MKLPVGTLISLSVTAAIAGGGVWWWSARDVPEPPPSALPPPLPAQEPRRPAGGPALPPVRPAPDPPAPGESFDRYLERPEGGLDVAAAALLLARESDAKVVPGAVLERFDAWCAERTEICRSAADREEFLERFLASAFGAGGLSFDADDPAAFHPNGWQFDRVFDRRIGVCLGLALVVQALADRVGLPCEPVALPEHVFLRVEAWPGRWRNVEVTAQGALRTDAAYRAEHGLPAKPPKGSLYLRPCGRRGLLALLCVNRSAWQLDGGRPADALVNADRALRLFPGLPAAYANRATALLALRRWEEAEAAAGRALAVHPHMAGPLVVRGAARLARGAAGPAAEDFAKALETSPLDLDARLGQGRARLMLGRWAESVADFRAVLARRSTDLHALRGLATALWRQRDYAAAGPVVRLLAAKLPQDADVAILAANVSVGLDAYEQAATHFDRAARLAPADPRGPRGLGLCAVHAGDRAAARKHLAAAAGLGADDQELHLLLGTLYRDVNDDAAAVRHWRRYVALGGDRDDVRRWLAANGK